MTIQEEIQKRATRIAALEAELESERNDLQTLRDAARILKLTGSPLAKAPVPAGDGKPAKYGELKHAIKQALIAVPPEKFSVKDIIEQILIASPGFNVVSNRSNVSTYLKEFSEDGQIALVQQGRGRMPTFYRIKK